LNLQGEYRSSALEALEIPGRSGEPCNSTVAVLRNGCVRFARVRRPVGNNALLLHSCIERSTFQSQAAGFIEGLDELIAIKIGENAPYRSAYRGPHARDLGR
jgi:hypothetical protein